MTTDGGSPDRVRVRLEQISSKAYEHPADRTALHALRSVPGFDQVLKWLSGLIRDRSHRLLFLGSGVKVDDRQFTDVHRLLVDACRVLDMPEVPDLFVVMDPQPNARTLGMDVPFMVVTTGTLDLLDDEELRFVLGHELGHVLSGHAVYRTMLDILLAISQRIVWMPVGYFGLRAIINALEEWYRKSELSCDRAGLLAGQDPAAALRTQMKMAGGSRLREMDVTAFLDQAREYDASGSLRDGVLKLLNLQGQRHPFAVLRAAELRRWVDSGDYQRILDGDYPRRGEEPPTSIRDEARAAAKSYRERMEESADPLMKLLRDVGEEATAFARRVADRVGNRAPEE